MKYFPLYKKTFSYHFTIAIWMLIFFGMCTFALYRVVVTLMPSRLSNNEDVTIVLQVLCTVLWLVVWAYDTFSTKGVFVYQDRIVIRNGIFPHICRRIKLTDIISVTYVITCNGDPDYYHHRYSTNLVVGGPKYPAAKIYTRHRGVRFIGVEDTGGLVTEILNRMENIVYPE